MTRPHDPWCRDVGRHEGPCLTKEQAELAHRVANTRALERAPGATRPPPTGTVAAPRSTWSRLKSWWRQRQLDRAARRVLRGRR